MTGQVRQVPAGAVCYVTPALPVPCAGMGVGASGEVTHGEGESTLQRVMQTLVIMPVCICVSFVTSEKAGAKRRKPFPMCACVTGVTMTGMGPASSDAQERLSGCPQGPGRWQICLSCKRTKAMATWGIPALTLQPWARPGLSCHGLSSF